jgi:hypothetical protein
MHWRCRPWSCTVPSCGRTCLIGPQSSSNAARRGSGAASGSAQRPPSPLRESGRGADGARFVCHAVPASTNDASVPTAAQETGRSPGTRAATEPLPPLSRPTGAPDSPVPSRARPPPAVRGARPGAGVPARPRRGGAAPPSMAPAGRRTGRPAPRARRVERHSQGIHPHADAGAQGERLVRGTVGPF